jgi:hypothetical protein
MLEMQERFYQDKDRRLIYLSIIRPKDKMSNIESRVKVDILFMEEFSEDLLFQELLEILIAKKLKC